MKARLAALALLLALCGGCATIGIRPPPVGRYAAVSRDAVNGPWITPDEPVYEIKFLTLQADGKYQASYLLVHNGAPMRLSVLGVWTMQQASSGTWTWSKHQLALHREGTPEGIAEMKRLGLEPHVDSGEAFPVAAHRDGQWTIVWDQEEYRLLTVQQEQALDSRDYRGFLKGWR